jgi:hypothetical protein
MGRGSWRPRVVLTCAICVLIAMSTLAAPASANTAAKAKPKSAALLFVVQGTGGTYTDNGNGTAALTLTGVNGSATWFNDRPQRQAGTTAIPAALEMIGFVKDPPNAVMTVSLADPKHDALAVKLETPSYDEANATLTFAATPLNKPPGAGLGAYRSQLDDSVEPSFGEFSLFIDDTNTRVTPTGAPTAAGGFNDFAIQVNAAARSTRQRIDIKPLWDAWNQCILEGTPNRVTNADVALRTAGSDYPTQFTLSAERNTSGSCGVLQSRMHWLLTRRGANGVEEIRVLGSALGPTVECVDLEAGFDVHCGVGANIELL